MRDLFKLFNKNTPTSEDKSSIPSDLADSNIPKPQYSPQENVKKNIHNVIEFLGNKPYLIGSIYSFLKRKDLKIFSQLDGIKADLMSLGLSYSNGGLPSLLRNGLLEELLNLDDEHLSGILKQADQNSEIKSFLSEIGINDHLLNQVGIPATSGIFLLLKQMKQVDEKFAPNLSLQLAEFIENNDKIKNLTKKERTKISKKDQVKLVELISSNNELIKKMTDSFLSSFIQVEEEHKMLLSSIFIKSAIGIDLLEDKREAIKEEKKTDIKKLNIENKLLDIRDKIGLKNNEKVKSVVNDLYPLINQALLSDKLKDLVNAGVNYKNVEDKSLAIADLMDKGLEFISDKKILTLLMNKKILKLNERFKSEPSKKVSYSELPEELFYPGFIDSLFSKEVLKKIIVDLVHLEEFKDTLKIRDQNVELLKSISPHLVDYMEPLVRNILSDRSRLNSLFINYQKFKANEDNSFVQDFLSLADDSKSLDIIFDSKDSDKILGTIIPQLEGIKTHLKKVIKTCLNEKEVIVALVNSYRGVQKNPNIENIDSFYKEINRFSTNPKILDSLLNPDLLATLLKKADISIFKEDLNPLKEALKEAVPRLISVTRQGYKDLLEDQDFKPLIARGQALIASPDRDKKGVSKDNALKISIDALEIFSNKKDLQDKLGKAINDAKPALAGIIDNSLSSLEKNKLKLRILKPLGINGDFIVSMIEKINNEKGLKALKNCLEEPTFSNGIRLILETQTQAFVVGHFMKSIFTHSLKKLAIITNPKTKVNEDLQQPKNKSWVADFSKQKSSRGLSHR